MPGKAARRLRARCVPLSRHASPLEIPAVFPFASCVPPFHVPDGRRRRHDRRVSGEAIFTGQAAQALDLHEPQACASEPIQIPGAVQPRGVLLALAADGRSIAQASDNSAAVLGVAPTALLGMPLSAVAGEPIAQSLAELAQRGVLDTAQRSLGALPASGGRLFDALAHRHDGVTIVELEPASDGPMGFTAFHPVVRQFVGRLQPVRDPGELARIAAAELRALTGFDRVLVYRFDVDWHGHVVAEDRGDRLPSYLGLRFPASDIPRQARELYLRNPSRLIADADYRPAGLVPLLHPDTGRPLDLSFAALRSVSPVHLEYMRNMGTAASMSLSLVVKGRLWGLVACHHAEPRALSFELRSACDHLAQVLSLQIESKQDNAEADRRLVLRGALVRLLAKLAEGEDVIDGLERNASELLSFAHADGAAILYRGRQVLLGRTPSIEQVQALVDWLSGSPRRDVVAVDNLSAACPGIDVSPDVAAGLMAVPISSLHRDYVIWFRREAVRTIAWAGDPAKLAAAPGQPDRLHPRASFDAWKQVVHGHCHAWRASEVDAAGEFRVSIVDIVLRRAEEMADLTDELQTANAELEAFSYSVSHDLRAPLRHVAGYADLLIEMEGARLSERGQRFVANMADAAQYAGRLVDSLLAFSQMGRAALQPVRVELRALVDEIIAGLSTGRGAEPDRAVQWRVGALPRVHADPAFLRLALENLLSNALKYSRNRTPALIEVGADDQDPAEHRVFVRDNGVGFDMRYAHKLFGVFQRLHRMEDFEGTGIGLANVRRIVARHGGRTWAEGVPDQGATFWFALPRRPED